MYEVSINGEVKNIEAQGILFENGSILFYCNKEKGLVDLVIPSGKWDYIKIKEESHAIQVKQTESLSVQSEAGSSEEVREGHEEENSEAIISESEEK